VNATVDLHSIFQAQNRETKLKSRFVLQDHYDDESQAWQDCVYSVSQHNTKPARPRPERARPITRPIFLVSAAVLS